MLSFGDMVRSFKNSTRLNKTPNKRQSRKDICIQKLKIWIFQSNWEFCAYNKHTIVCRCCRSVRCVCVCVCVSCNWKWYTHCTMCVGLWKEISWRVFAQYSGSCVRHRRSNSFSMLDTINEYTIWIYGADPIGNKSQPAQQYSQSRMLVCLYDTDVLYYWHPYACVSLHIVCWLLHTLSGPVLRCGENEIRMRCKRNWNNE